MIWKVKQRKKHTHQEAVILCFFGVKCFLFFKSICKWLLQHNISTVCFFYQGFLSRTLTTHRKTGEGRESSFVIPLYHLHPLMNIQTFFATLRVTWLSHIFNRTACIYQTATRCLFTWWFDPRLLLQHLDRGNRWTRTRIDYHTCIIPSRLTKCASHSVSTVKYFIPYLSVLDQRRIQNFVRHLTYSFLQKLFTTLGS